jgi:predicted amidohydrolase
LLCCPEAVLGGLAHESAGQSPSAVALGVENGELAEVLAPLLDTPMTVVVGFTERAPTGDIFNSAAVVAGGRIAAVYRKVFPGYRTAYRAGTELPVHRCGPTPFGVIICNDLWYVEPARLLSSTGAAVILVPTNSGHQRAPADSFRARGENLPIARAVENTTTVVVADIAGRQGDRFAHGFTAIVDPDGVVLARAAPMVEALLVADVEPQRRPYDPRGLDGHTNPTVAAAFLDLWRPGAGPADEATEPTGKARSHLAAQPHDAGARTATYPLVLSAAEPTGVLSDRVRPPNAAPHGSGPEPASCPSEHLEAEAT